MRKIFLVVVLMVFVALQIHAQPGKHVWNKPNYDQYLFHFGFALGYNKMDFRVVPSANMLTEFDSVFAVQSMGRSGFNIHMVGNLRLGSNFDLRFIPGLAFGQRDLKYNHRVIDGIDTSFSTHLMQIESTMLSFPFYVKYRAHRINNWRPYVLFGGNYTFDLESRKKIKEEEQPKIKLARQDFYIEAGVGVDYYFPFFKLATELRFSFGLLDMISRDNTEYSMFYDQLNSRMFTLLIFVE